MSEIVLEYTGTSPARFKDWRTVLRDVGFARGYGPAHGQPGYEENERQAAQAVDLLQPHLDTLARGVDIGHPHVAAQLETIRRSLENSKQPPGKRRVGSVSLDLSHMMDAIEVLLLGLIGPEGNSPVAQGQVEFPTQPYLVAWFATSTGCPNLVPNVDATQTVSWRTERAFLLPEQAKAVAELEPSDVSFEECCAVLENWNTRSPSKVWVGPPDSAEGRRYDDWQACFREGLTQLQLGLGEIAEAGEIYLGWTTWYGYE